jgi:hypothetical protein
MGSNAPAWGITGETAGGIEAYQDQPRPLEQDNFELPKAEGGKFQFGVDEWDPSHFENHAVDPIEPGQPEYTGR